MKKSPTPLFWKIYSGATAALLVFIISFFVFFYDYIGAYEESQPIYAAQRYAQSMSDVDLRTLFAYNTAVNATVLESPERIADAYCQAIGELEGELYVEPDYASSSADALTYTVVKGDTPIVSITICAEPGGRYGFDVWKLASSRAITEHLFTQAKTYEITVPSGSVVSVNAHILSESYLTNSDASYALAHPLEKQMHTPCETYTISDMLSTPEIQCVWNGSECVGVQIGDQWHFAYPDSAHTSFTVTAPSGADIYVNGVLLGDEYAITKGKQYEYSVYDQIHNELPTENVYLIEGLMHQPEIGAELNGVKLEAVLEGTSVQIPYPQELMYSEIICVPAGCTVSVNGHILEDSLKTSKIPAYPELFSHSEPPIYMDRYELTGLYKPVKTVSVVLDGNELNIRTTEEGRVATHYASYPSADNTDVSALAIAFCKDYFAYTAGGYRNTEANLNRVLAYLATNSELYRRIMRSKESVGFVTPVTSQKFNTLTVDVMEQLSDSRIVCSVTYEIEQWTYQVKREYSGRLWLAFELFDQQWTLTQMLTDIK